MEIFLIGGTRKRRHNYAQGEFSKSLGRGGISWGRAQKIGEFPKGDGIVGLFTQAARPSI